MWKENGGFAFHGVKGSRTGSPRCPFPSGDHALTKVGNVQGLSLSLTSDDACIR